MRKFLDIVVTSSVHIVRRVLMLTRGVQLLGMVKRDDFISTAVDYVDRAVYVFYAVNIGKFVERQGPSQVENNSQSSAWDNFFWARYCTNMALPHYRHP